MALGGQFGFLQQVIRNRNRFFCRKPLALRHDHGGNKREFFFVAHQFTSSSNSSSSTSASLAARPGLRPARNSSIGSAGLFLSSPVGLTLARLCGVSPSRSRQATIFFSAVSAILSQ